jgi:hypothetical protein
MGTNITHLKHAIKGFPLEIPYQGHMVVRGEAAISYSDFAAINDMIEDEDEKYANPRNLASGTLNLDDVEEVKTTTISFVKGGLVSWQRPRFWGRCKHKSLGKVYCYIPAPFPERLVLIRTKNGQHYVFGCTCVDEFIEYVNSRILKGTIQ